MVSGPDPEARTSTEDYSKPDFKRLAHRNCHPERSEGSLREILRSAQNDKSEGARCEMYECHALWFRFHH